MPGWMAGGTGQARRIGLTRLAIGFCQGLGFYGLTEAVKLEAWPASDHLQLAAISTVLLFTPLIWLAGLGALRRAPLVAWLVVAAVIAAGLAGYEVWREADLGAALFQSGGHPIPTFLAIAAALFIGHHLVAAAEEARRPIAPYPLYFDTAWKHAVQLGLSLAFLGAFWAVLELGAALFSVIGLKALQTTINKPWFALPVSGLVFAGGVHLTDVRATITRGLRAIGLMLLSWLMPVMGLLCAAFLLSLPFTGIDALWKVGHAAALLLAASAALIVLLNAAYQDGSAETRAPKPLQWIGRLTALVLLPMAALIGWGLEVRIAQHGFTPDRIIALGCLVAAACYAAGYAVAAVRPGPWLKGLERTNIIAAYLDLAIILALFTPLADPARISAADQTARLESGRIAPDVFDYRFLRFDAGRWGRDALRRLAKGGQGPHAAEIARDARAALALQNRWTGQHLAGRPEARDLTRTVVMHPAAAALPASLVQQVQADPSVLPVLTVCNGAARCDGYVLDLGPADRADVLIVPRTGMGTLLRPESNGIWTVRGSVWTTTCAGSAEAVQTGAVRPVSPELQDLDVGGHRVRIGASVACEPAPAPAVSP